MSEKSLINVSDRPYPLLAPVVFDIQYWNRKPDPMSKHKT
jgi:hypothetical protein